VGRRVAAEQGWELIEGTAAWADPAGLINRQTYENLRDEILDQLRDAMPVDGVVLGLHGAMVADGYDDPEGDFLSHVRHIVGPDTLICAGLDPHSHLTEKRITATDFFAAFKESPHTDFVARAEDLWQIAVARLKGQAQPVMSVFDCRMIDVFPTSTEPMRSFVDRLFDIEKTDPDILSISVIHGFMAADVPEMGTKIIVVTNKDKIDKGTHLAEKFGLELFAMRGTFMTPQVDEKVALASALKSKHSPVVIADTWDNPGGGTAGDATVILQESIKQNISNIAFGTIWDPIAVQIAHAAGEGAMIQLRFGAKSAPDTGAPIDQLVRVIKNVKNAEQHFGESRVPLGDCTLIRFNDIEIILNSTRAQCFDTSLFDMMDIDPRTKKILVIKSTNHFYESFAQISDEIIYCSAGRPYPNDPATTPYQKVRRNIWPRVADPFAAVLKQA
jgi:microcystin degradation protein MlrC